MARNVGIREGSEGPERTQRTQRTQRGLEREGGTEGVGMEGQKGKSRREEDVEGERWDGREMERGGAGDGDEGHGREMGVGERQREGKREVKKGEETSGREKLIP